MEPPGPRLPTLPLGPELARSSRVSGSQELPEVRKATAYGCALGDTDFDGPRVGSAYIAWRKASRMAAQSAYGLTLVLNDRRHASKVEN